MIDGLKQRVVTAIILLIALLALTLFTRPFIFAAVVAVIVALAAWEWTAFVGIEGIALKASYTSALFVMLMGAASISGFSGNADTFISYQVMLILGLGLLWWCIAAFLLIGYPESSAAWNDKFKISLMGLLTLIPTWTGLVALKYALPSGYFVLGVVIMVAGVDIGAYFVGRFLGARPLAPSLSPNKTWEGVWGGFITCCAVSALLIWGTHRYLFELRPLQVSILLLSCVITTFFAVVGDLFESMLKRNSDLKDSGSTLPGHGGILDRIDALLAVTPSSVIIVMLTLDQVH